MKRYEVDYYYITFSGEDKAKTGEKYLGSLTFSHVPSRDYPVERKAFMLAPANLMVANKLKIRELR